MQPDRARAHHGDLFQYRFARAPRHVLAETDLHQTEAVRRIEQNCPQIAAVALVQRHHRPGGVVGLNRGVTQSLRKQAGGQSVFHREIFPCPRANKQQRPGHPRTSQIHRRCADVHEPGREDQSGTTARP